MKLTGANTAPPSGSAKAAMVDLFNGFSEEEQAFLRGLADETKDLLREGKFYEAWAKCSDGLDTEEQFAMWGLFSSTERASLYKGKP